MPVTGRTSGARKIAADGSAAAPALGAQRILAR